MPTEGSFLSSVQILVTEIIHTEKISHLSAIPLQTKITPLTVSRLCFLTLPSYRCYRCFTTRSTWVKSADFMSTFDFDFAPFITYLEESTACRQWTRPSIKYFPMRSGAWNIRLRSWSLMWFCDNLFNLWVLLYVIRNIYWIGIFVSSPHEWRRVQTRFLSQEHTWRILTTLKLRMHW